MTRLLFLYVIITSSLLVASEPSRWEERKSTTELDLIINSTDYIVRNPIKVTVISYLIVNQILNGKNSLLCQGYKWVTVTLPHIVMQDGYKVIDKVKETSNEIYEFLRSSFIENPQV